MWAGGMDDSVFRRIRRWERKNRKSENKKRWRKSESKNFRIRGYFMFCFWVMKNPPLWEDHSYLHYIAIFTFLSSRRWRDDEESHPNPKKQGKIVFEIRNVYKSIQHDRNKNGKKREGCWESFHSFSDCII